MHLYSMSHKNTWGCFDLGGGCIIYETNMDILEDFAARGTVAPHENFLRHGGTEDIHLVGGEVGLKVMVEPSYRWVVSKFT